MIYKFTFVFLPASGIGYCAVPDLIPPPPSEDWLRTYKSNVSDENKINCFRPLLCTLLRLKWAKQTPGTRR